MSGLTLDAGALVAFEKNDRRLVSVLARALERGASIVVPAGAVAQVWRDGRRQARLARFLGAHQVQVVPLDDTRARAAGQLCGVTRTRDVVDASIVLCARDRGHTVLTSDVRDLQRLDPSLAIVRV